MGVANIIYALFLLGPSIFLKATAQTHPIVIKGNAFFDSKTNERFYIRGVDYQPGGSSSLVDPLASRSCKKDVEIFKKLGINTVRVYQVDNSADHDKCMNALSEAGIYVILDLNTYRHSISRAHPALSYNKVYLQHLFATIDAFKGYDNVLGFFSGNEVVNDEDTTAITWVKAVTRDVKAYIKKHSDRHIPVGYSAADVAENRLQLAHYFNCGDESERADFYAFNMYEWCGYSSMTVSGYYDRIKEFSNYSIPLFLSEFGCNTVEINDDTTPNRPFTEIEAIYSHDMTPVFSGGLVYEYSAEPNHYGLVVIDKDDERRVSRNFITLMKQYAKTPNPKGDGGYKKAGSPSKCPANSTQFNAWEKLPEMPEGAKIYMEKGAGEPLGIEGPTNMWSPFHDGDDDESTSRRPKPKNKPSNVTSTTSYTSGMTSSSESGSSKIGVAFCQALFITVLIATLSF
ncbi:1,3-beta-glucanosyltransferase gas4 [Schizosaccharomyces pombe]|uniref:1,3-beta-glucanosyltransferase gas4 n=1 Tax=Schizosaccharomyces pombe (strain 972 / ATCC 24843) TaxID=284812 RepID=GAS4_SCHPO|nr:1,3-beta-glucanosyltransferase Gas4 [Schizosaccharomyces pombe]Q9Y7Y7.1 RecName: Full=1,3-beta-glucanosyltransferase gas4; Flags: Precursor [Schizosaccharomyces pombe 972h-]CAB46773.1 sporulation specific 1,3-beta-glucanosyltransferase Gas4 [Schizosaccharomyces pombe]|eukprot:NP_596746.1 1,3-beta-glucanosyltransferase Gas4 [Schizosaccharomyces pombe]